MNKRIAVTILVIVTGLGMIYSVWDYKKWRWEETKNYGHGPGEQLVAAEQLTQRYEQAGMGLRLGYPSNWKIVDNPRLLRWQDNKQLGWSDLIGVDTRVEVVKISREEEISLQVNIERLAKENNRRIEDEANRLREQGIIFTKEREYINTERENWAIFTWEEGEIEVREAVTIKGERLVTIKVDCLKKALNRWRLTEDEIIKSVKIF